LPTHIRCCGAAVWRVDWARCTRAHNTISSWSREYHRLYTVHVCQPVTQLLSPDHTQRGAPARCLATATHQHQQPASGYTRRMRHCRPTLAKCS